MGAQTSVSQDPSAAYEGQVENWDDADIISKVAEAAISNGQAVIQGTGNKQCKLPAAAGDITGLPLLGVAVYDRSKPTAWPPGVTQPYPIGQMVSIARKGRVWVYVEEAVTPASTVYCRHTSNGGNTVLGRFRASNDSNTAAAMPSSRFMTSASAGGFALLDLNLP